MTALEAVRRMTTLTAGEDHGLDTAGLHDGFIAGENPAFEGVPPQASRRDFLQGMRQVASSVAVVTTVGPGGRHGATVSAFASVSADPPTILVCLRSASRIAEAVRRNGVFTVSVLAEEQVHLARLFAGEFDHTRADRFADVLLVPFPGLAPGIANASIFACTVTETMQQHTHSVVFGQVAHVATSRRQPLLYHGGSYTLLQRSPNP